MALEQEVSGKNGEKKVWVSLFGFSLKFTNRSGDNDN